MKISYDNTKETYADMALMKIYYSRKHILKCIFMCLLVAAFFGMLCLLTYNNEVDVYGSMRDSMSAVLLVYIVCGILWIIVVPMLYWKLKSAVIYKEIEKLSFSLEGQKTIELDDCEIVVRDNNFTKHIKMQGVKDVIERKKFIDIKIKGQEDLTFPTTAFSDDNQKQEFIRIITEKTSKNVNE